MAITHPFFSAKGDGADDSIVQASDWNDSHAHGAEAANLVFAGPSSGANAAPTFRSLVAADVAPVGVLLADGTIVGSTSQAQDFGSTGIKSDVIAESTPATGVTLDSVLLKDQEVVLLGDNKALELGAGVGGPGNARIYYDGTDLVLDAKSLAEGGTHQVKLIQSDLQFPSGGGDIYLGGTGIIQLSTSTMTLLGLGLTIGGANLIFNDTNAVIRDQGEKERININSTGGGGTLLLKTHLSAIAFSIGASTPKMVDCPLGFSASVNGSAAVDFQNSDDEASNEVAIFKSGNRTGGAGGELGSDDDEGYNSFFNDDSTGTQVEFARQTWKALDVTNTTKDAQFEFAVMKANVLTDCLLLGALTTTLTADTIALTGDATVSGTLGVTGVATFSDTLQALRAGINIAPDAAVPLFVHDTATAGNIGMSTSDGTGTAKGFINFKGSGSTNSLFVDLNVEVDDTVVDTDQPQWRFFLSNTLDRFGVQRSPAGATWTNVELLRLDGGGMIVKDSSDAQIGKITSARGFTAFGTGRGLVINSGGDKGFWGLRDSTHIGAFVFGGDYLIVASTTDIRLTKQVNIGSDADATGSHKLHVRGTALFDSSVEIDGDLDHDGSNIGFFGTAPAAQAGAYTQTYSTADKTHANPTATAVGDLVATSGGWGYSTEANADKVHTAIDALIVDVADVKQVVNAIIDDLQAYGLITP